MYLQYPVDITYWINLSYPTLCICTLFDVKKKAFVPFNNVLQNQSLSLKLL